MTALLEDHSYIPHPPANKRAVKRSKVDLNYHQIKCAICNHPERDAIEEAFLDWGRPAELTREFSLGHRTVVYRHAHALGLFKKRAQNARRALEPILEESSVIQPTANDIIRGVRAYSCINEYGKWTHPSRRLIVTHLDAKGAEIPPDKVDPDWKLARHPSGPTKKDEESLGAADAAPKPTTAKTKEPQKSPVQSEATGSGRTLEAASPKSEAESLAAGAAIAPRKSQAVVKSIATHDE